ncbi:hypothetical protein ACHAXS_014344 [Conticribra weissflogii]
MTAPPRVTMVARNNGRILCRQRHALSLTSSQISKGWMGRYSPATSSSSYLPAVEPPHSRSLSSWTMPPSQTESMPRISHFRLIFNRIVADLDRYPTKRSIYTTNKTFSDNLLGYSPMASPLPKSSASSSKTGPATNKEGGAIWGVDSNTAGGGVWAQTSAKRDKLNELLTELRESKAGKVKNAMTNSYMPNLDDAATSEEKLDLKLADGLKVLASWVDAGGVSVGNDGGKLGEKAESAKNRLFQMLDNSELPNNADGKHSEGTTSEENTTAEVKNGNVEWNQWKFEASMKEAIRILSSGLPPDPPKKPLAGKIDVNHPLCYIREFMGIKDEHVFAIDEITSESSQNINDDDEDLQLQIQTLNEITSRTFSSSVHLYRALLLRATAQTMLDNWSKITAVTSGDVDRAAVSKTVILSQRSTVNVKNIRDVFKAYADGNNEDMVRTWWGLLDADGDGMLDEEEMNDVVHLAMQPVHLALGELLRMALEACPVRRVGLGTMEAEAWFLDSNDEENVRISSLMSHSSSQENDTAMTSKLSWRNRRAELHAKKMLIKTFQGTLFNHFRDQVETPHRLRCIYAWAEKSHQENKIDSILVDASDEWGAASSIVGRKRYVELMPKISFKEFQEVQKKHFPHLDRVGEEIVMSFKEDIWVVQGKRRQSNELRRDCFLFLLGVSLVDIGIGMV